MQVYLQLNPVKSIIFFLAETKSNVNKYSIEKNWL